MTDTTVVLVHGAFAESASWNGVLARLQSAGVAAIATPNPLRSVSTDADSVRAAVAGVNTPVLLVGHSYGGAVITEAAADSHTVRGLVYVAAFAPDHGETALELTAQFPGSTLADTIQSYPLGDGSNDLIVNRALFPQQFAADIPTTDAQLQAATQRAIRDVALSEPLPTEQPAWKTKPSWFIYGTADKNIPAEALHFMAERANPAGTQVIEGASHSVMVSHPDQVADIIFAALRRLDETQ